MVDFAFSKKMLLKSKIRVLQYKKTNTCSTFGANISLLEGERKPENLAEIPFLFVLGAGARLIDRNCREKWDIKAEVVELDETCFFALQGKDGSSDC